MHWWFWSMELLIFWIYYSAKVEIYDIVYGWYIECCTMYTWGASERMVVGMGHNCRHSRKLGSFPKVAVLPDRFPPTSILEEVWKRGNILFSSCSESFVTFLWFFRAPSWINESSHWLHIRAGNSETRQALYLCQCRHEPHFRWLVTPVTQHYVNTFLANLDSKKYVLYHQLLNTFLANVDSK